MGKKVICIDAGDIKWCINHGIIPLEEGAIYTVRAETIGARGEGYLLKEIINRTDLIVDCPGKEPDYARRRFIPLSTIDETDKITVHNHDDVYA